MKQKKIKPNVHAQWHPLKCMVVGKSFDPEYYDPIRDSRVRDGLQLIAEQTEQDFQNLISVLQSFSVDVLRVDPGYRNIELDICNNIDFACVPMSPMMPRNDAIVIGDRLLMTAKGNAGYNAVWYQNIMAEHLINPWSLHTNPDLGSWQLPQHQQFHAPYVTRVGNRLWVDGHDYHWLPDYFRQNLPDYDVIQVNIGGHNDGCFSPVIPGKILSIMGETHYKHTFPGWEVFFPPPEKRKDINGWSEMKYKTQGRWFIDNDTGVDVNDRMIEFVDTWLNQWVGYVEETMFDVNCLVLDRNHVCFTAHNPDLWDWCAKNSITPILVPFRHRFFWDGGLHCMTLDLVRDGDAFDFANCL
jgi:hypothetical protein